MKTSKIIIILLFSIQCFAQNDTIKGFSFSGGFNYNIAFGNTFLNKGYKDQTGLNFEYQFTFRKFFTGVRIDYFYGGISNYSLIGNFDKVKGSSFYPFVGYRQKIPIQKIYLEHRLGFGFKEMNNYSYYGNYKISGTFGMIGTRINYQISPNFNFYTGLDLNYTDYQVELNGPYRSFYRNGYQFTPSLGLKFLFGRKIKM
jgi:hypothetical protein